MSKIALTPNTSGTGTLTLAAPNTNTDRTLTLPDATTTLVGTDATQTLSNKTIAASQLTGALPAIDGSALTGVGSLTLLGTLATTSGATQTLSGLNLTSYKFLVMVFKDVSSTVSAGFGFVSPAISLSTVTAAAGNGVSGILTMDLISGVLTSASTVNASTTSFTNQTSPYTGYQNVITTASTSIGFAFGGGTFDAGSITIYGVK